MKSIKKILTALPGLIFLCSAPMSFGMIRGITGVGLGVLGVKAYSIQQANPEASTEKILTDSFLAFGKMGGSLYKGFNQAASAPVITTPQSDPAILALFREQMATQERYNQLLLAQLNNAHTPHSSPDSWGASTLHELGKCMPSKGQIVLYGAALTAACCGGYYLWHYTPLGTWIKSWLKVGKTVVEIDANTKKIMAALNLTITTAIQNRLTGSEKDAFNKLFSIDEIAQAYTAAEQTDIFKPETAENIKKLPINWESVVRGIEIKLREQPTYKKMPVRNTNSDKPTL